MQALQDRLATVSDPETGAIRPDKIKGAIDSIKKEWQKGYMTQSDHVTPADINALSDLSRAARGAGTNVAGLSPEGQMLLLDHLRAGAAKAGPNSPEAALAAQFESHLAGQSPSLAAHISAAATTGPEIAARQAQQEALSTATDKINSIVSSGGKLNARNAAQALDGLVGGGEHAHGDVGTVASQFLSDLQNKAAVSSAGLKAEVPQYGGLLGKIMGHQFGGGIGAGLLLHGDPLRALGTFATRHVLGKGQAAVDRAAVNLTHGDANRLADVLEQIHLSRQ
jgi:hypothetical protein